MKPGRCNFWEGMTGSGGFAATVRRLPNTKAVNFTIVDRRSERQSFTRGSAASLAAGKAAVRRIIKARTSGQTISFICTD